MSSDKEVKGLTRDTTYPDLYLSGHAGAISNTSRNPQGSQDQLPIAWCLAPKLYPTEVMCPQARAKFCPQWGIRGSYYFDAAPMNCSIRYGSRILEVSMSKCKKTHCSGPMSLPHAYQKVRLVKMFTRNKLKPLDHRSFIQNDPAPT